VAGAAASTTTLSWRAAMTGLAEILVHLSNTLYLILAMIMCSEVIPGKTSSSLIGIDSLLSIVMVDVIRAIEKILTL